jgi:Ca-activated chloride channel homolog
MRFAYPWMLALVLLVPLVAWLKGKLGRQPAFLYSSVALVRNITGITRSTVGAILLRLRWFALLLFITALARPQLGEGDTKVKASGIDIVIAIDVSGSMAAEDFELKGQAVNRLTIARDVVGRFIEKRLSDRIGLVAFGAKAYIATPLTLDHPFLLQNLERMQLGMIEDGTAIGSAISASVNRLRDLKAKSKVVVLMTDGQNNSGKIPPITAAEAAEALGIRIYSIGVGTKGLARIPYVNVFGQKGYVEQEVNIDEETLTEVARKTGGKYFRAQNTAGLLKIYEEIDKLEKTDADVKKYEHYRELFHWPVLGGLVILLLEIILANTVWRKLP